MDTEKNIVTVKLISRNPEHAKLFESNEMQKIFIETPSHSSSGNSNSVNSKDKTISRVEGKTRIHTATEISKKYFKNADKVILVSSTQLADSLISPVHAKRLDSPILLSGKDFLDKSVLDELKRLNTSSVDIVGGENSIGENVVKELENNGIKVNRIAGEDRYKTSIKLAEQMYKDSKYDEVFVVDGTNIADGLSVANFSTKVNAPVILTSPEKIDKSAIDFMNTKSIKKVHIIGGTNSVSRNVENSLNKFKTNRIAGENRYETSRMIANLAYPNAKSIHIANGVTGIDALVSGAIIPKTNMPLILVNENDISTSKLLQNSSIKNINIIGGNDSISKNFINSVIK